MSNGNTMSGNGVLVDKRLLWTFIFLGICALALGVYNTLASHPGQLLACCFNKDTGKVGVISGGSCGGSCRSH